MRAQADRSRPSELPLQRQLREAGPVVRLLVVTQLAFNVGFFMVLPYLSVHLARDLGLAPALVGLALGLRTFSQQGLFVVGGALADRYGTAPVVWAGCVFRIAGFEGLALADTAPQVLLATVAVGFAAALFSPAVEAALSSEAGQLERAGGPSRASAFALFSVMGQIGALTGPPCTPASRWRRLARGGWQPALRAVRAGLQRAARGLQPAAPAAPARGGAGLGSQQPLGWLFALSALLVVVGQLRLTARLRDRPVRGVLVGGFALLAGSFAVVAVTLPAGLTGVGGLAPLVAFVLLLTLGEMVVLPFVRDAVPHLVGERRLGTSYGLLASAGGLAVLLGSAGVGLLLQLGPPALAWSVTAALPLLNVLALRRISLP